MKVFYYTFGCKVNQYETENIKELMEARGDVSTDSIGGADVCIVNSCTVTSEADKKCRQLIHRIRKANPRCILVCAGCMTQAADNIAEILPECDIIVGSHSKTSIPLLIDRFIDSGERIVSISSNEDSRAFEPMCNRLAEDKTRAYIKIQDGCDMSCSYCIIPRARGHIRSKSIEEIKKEAALLIDSGHKELILTGINLCCYGRENGGRLRLTDAVEAVCGLEGDFRVRLSSMEPELISDSDIQRLAALEKLCPHFHLSLQSGCNRTLKAMNRHYTSKEYALLCRKMRDAFPSCAITTDIMVGFPGETEQDHKESLAFAEKTAFAEAHIFPYSRRPNTPADLMKDQIDGSTKHRRAAEMDAVCRRTQSEYLDSFCGKTVRVLYEKESSPEFHQGHTDSYVLVKVPRFSDTSMRRRFGLVKILSAEDGCCIGEPVSKDIN